MKIPLRMNKFSTKIDCFFFLLLIFIPHSSYSQDKVKNIVVFFSLNANLPANQNMLEGLKSSLNEKLNGSYNLITEYIDFGMSPNEEYTKYVIGIYKTKYKFSNIDLLITSGPGVKQIMEKYGYEALEKRPTININFLLYGQRASQNSINKNIFEINLKFNVNNTLKTAFAIFPDYKNVYIISGSSDIDLYFKSLVDSCKRDFEPDYHFTHISGMTLDSTIQAAKKIKPKSIILVSSFLSDKTNIPYSTQEVIRILSNKINAPVFQLSDAFIKQEGGIGGYVLSFKNIGTETGRIASEILIGKTPKEITLNESNFYQNIYDWQELKKWHLLNSKVIPKDSIFYNRDTSFFMIYKWYILGLFIFLVSQTILIIYLIRLNRRQKVISERMLETENMHRDLIRTDRLSKMSTLTASLSHELFQPLAAIRFSAQAGKRFIQTGNLDMSRASGLFENILEDDIRATGIITSVKSLMKTDTPEKESVNLNSLIHETVDIIRSDAKKQRININLNFEKDPLFVFGDKIQLQQVLMNFIRNAMSAMEKSDPENRFLEIIMNLNKESVIVSVRDSGPGIDPAIKEKLFKPFVTTKKEGFGIGLTLCRSLIEKHNGKIWAQNLAEGGTIFSFSLQVHKNE